MNWIKGNKFLFGFLVVMAIGVGVLTYFLLAAMGRSDDAKAEYTQKVGELNRLQRLPIFPNQANLEKLAEQKKQVAAEVSKLAEHVALQQIPPQDITPEVFQDNLKATVTALKAQAEKSSPPVELLGKFFLGFDDYETRPPDRNAAPALGRELKAIEWLVGQLLEKKVTVIREIVRPKIPEEGKAKADDKKPAARPVAASPAAEKGSKASISHAVQKNQIVLSFQCNQLHLRDFLNGLVSYQGQFFIPRLITVRNEHEKGPLRAPLGGSSPGGTATGAPEPPPAGAPPVPGVPGQIGAVSTGAPPAPVATFIVGEERVEVVLVVEMVVFTEVAAK